ncbi:MAG: dihydroorotate dehydrogenase electron transfer subunit [Candidatus Krumholzibacteria bacterium]|nr:dihydroorotate dehydrogenase electron transfer subunit [Candidatus Krumholzibacteria bacterium]MDH4336983.1 dihydroorotate dehydrogenase electron transfer subunit [Candidatus Krumholzibacteria bacterium]MDH5270702.1 dihydroorotate dehydrogenase electron transfer subunit [Candidatus Krumholzibacteria bacterium]
MAAFFAPAHAHEHSARVIDNVQLSRRYFLLRLARPDGFVEPQAGQFVHVAVPAAGDGRFFLRRPFSIHDCTREFIDLVIVEVGPGSRALRHRVEGDRVDFYGPLGHPYPVLPGKRILGLGGGVGLAPLYYYGFRAPGNLGDGYRLIYGARTREDLFLEHVPLETRGVILATDDGSHGFQGNVVQAAERELAREPADAIFSCGPTVMMRAAQALADRMHIPHYASLENRMGCALGACRACVVPTTLDGGSHYRTVCHDGPVFDGSILRWKELPVP